MAQPTNTFDTYDSVGIREDLSDVIHNISQRKHPFTASLLKKPQEHFGRVANRQPSRFCRKRSH